MYYTLRWRSTRSGCWCRTRLPTGAVTPLVTRTILAVVAARKAKTATRWSMRRRRKFSHAKFRCFNGHAVPWRSCRGRSRLVADRYRACLSDVCSDWCVWVRHGPWIAARLISLQSSSRDHFRPVGRAVSRSCAVAAAASMRRTMACRLVRSLSIEYTATLVLAACSPSLGLK
eukprot:SAG31_NODE_8441_length_1451_cov_4.840976_1_plen_173_part_00